MRICDVWGCESLENRTLLTAIAGVFYADNNYSGTHDAGEPSATTAVATVYIDANNNGVLDAGEPQSATTTGSYYFAGVDPGTYTLRAVAGSGFVVTDPANNGALTVTVPSQLPPDQTFVAGGDFGLAPMPAPGSISGFLYQDNDRSGTPTPGDAFGSFANVFLDLNNDAVREASEPQAVITNNYGQFTFTGLQPGTYTVRAIENYYALLTPATQTYSVTLSQAPYPAVETSVTGLAFGFAKQSMSAAVYFYNDINHNGTYDTGDTSITSGTGAYADLNNNGQRDPTEPVIGISSGASSYSAISGLPNGTITLRGLGGTDYTPTTVATFTLPSPAFPTVRLGFVPKDDVSTTINGTVFLDANNNGLKDSGEGGVNDSRPLPRVYADLNNNGSLDANEPSTQVNSSGNYTLGVSQGTVTLRLIFDAQYYQQSAPAGGSHSVQAAGGTAVTGQDFGLAPFGAISGVMFNDTNRNGTLDAGETGLNGYVVYVDANRNGQYDYGESSYTTLTAGSQAGYFNISGLLPGTYSLRQIVPSGYRQLAPATAGYTVTLTGNIAYVTFADNNTGGASISGIAYNDANGNGVKDTGEIGLSGISIWDDADNDGQIDSNEQQATTDAYGQYTLRGLPAGTYRLRALFFSNYTQTSPAAAGASVTVATNEAKAGIYFGARTSQPSSISGYVFSDSNSNGVMDAGETGLANVNVFLDTNKNGVLDAGESVSVTDSAGFWYAQSAGGVGTIRFAFSNQTGRTLTTPASYDITPVTNQNYSGLVFGLAPAPTTTSATLQAEDAVLTGGTAKATNHSGYTGTGFADFGGNGSAAQFAYSAATAGAATLTFRYANGGTSARPLSVIVNGTAVGSIACNPTGGWDTWNTVTISANLIAGTNNIQAVAGAATGGNVDSLTITPTGGTTPTPPATFTPVHIDSGGGASGIYSADGGYSGGSTYSTTAAIDTSAVASPASQSVYQTERFGNFTYNLAGLTAGKQYTVTLHFDELYWTATGKRVFNVTGNGAAWLTNFDIFASAGAMNKAITRSFTATADSAGKIAIVFTGVKDNAKVNAIDVVEAGTTTPVTPASTYINAGGSATGSFAADTAFSGGKTTTVTNAIDTSAVTSPAPQAVYQTERYGNFTYTIANLVVGQQYTLSLDFAETYWTAAGQRVFNVAVNGQTQLSNFDVYAAAGAKFKAVRKQFTVTPDSTGKVAITFTTVKDNAKVSGIELVPVA